MLRGGSEARMPPRVVEREPRTPDEEPCGRAGVTVLADLPPVAPERFTVPLERRAAVLERLTSVEGLVTVPEDLPVPELERETLLEDLLAELPEVVDLRFWVLTEGREAVLPEREELELERETLPEERLAELPVERLAELPEVVDLRFCVLTEGREAVLPERVETELERETLPVERLALEEGRETLAEEREELEEGRDMLPEERLAPPPYEERPALDEEDRETEDELRLEDDDEARPPPPRDCAKAVSGERAMAATTIAARAILKNLFISAVLFG